MENAKKIRKIRVGVVVSDKMEKSVMVSVESLTRHPLYGKYMKKRVKFMAHDEKNECKVGDKVLIVESKPISKNKFWKVKEVIERAAV